MRKIISIILILVLILSVSVTFASADDKIDKPAFERIGLSRRTINLSECGGETFEFITSSVASNSTNSATCDLSAEWVTVFDPEIGYSEDMTSFYVPDGVFANNVQFPGSAQLFKNLDGYEWRCGHFIISSPTTFHFLFTYEDYYTDQHYDVEGNVDTNVTDDNGLTSSGTFSITFNEIEYDNCFLYMNLQELSKVPDTVAINVFYRIPCGYDGCVFGVIDSRNYQKEKTTGQIDSSDLARGASDYYFRMK